MSDTPTPVRGGAYEIAPDGTRRRLGGTEEPPMPGPREADGTPIGRVVPPALPELGPNAPGEDRAGPPAARKR